MTYIRYNRIWNIWNVSCSVVLSKRIDVFQPSPHKDNINYSLFYSIKYRTIIPYYAWGQRLNDFCFLFICRFDYSCRIIVFVKSYEPYCLVIFCPMFTLHNTSIVIGYLFIGFRLVVLQVELMKCLLEAWALS